MRLEQFVLVKEMFFLVRIFSELIHEVDAWVLVLGVRTQLGAGKQCNIVLLMFESKDKV